MSTDQLVYTVFGVVILLALILDLGFLSKKGSVMTISKAMNQTFFWILLAFAFFAFLWFAKLINSLHAYTNICPTRTDSAASFGPTMLIQSFQSAKPAFGKPFGPTWFQV